MKLIDALHQMNDGIHYVRDFMVVTDHVERISPYYKGLPFDDTILDIDRETLEGVLDRINATDTDYESLYTDYNSFGYSPNLKRWYAWYDNTR